MGEKEKFMKSYEIDSLAGKEGKKNSEWRNSRGERW